MNIFLFSYKSRITIYSKIKIVETCVFCLKSLKRYYVYVYHFPYSFRDSKKLVGYCKLSLHFTNLSDSYHVFYPL